MHLTDMSDIRSATKWRRRRKISQCVERTPSISCSYEVLMYRWEKKRKMKSTLQFTLFKFTSCHSAVTVLTKRRILYIKRSNVPETTVPLLPLYTYLDQRIFCFVRDDSNLYYFRLEDSVNTNIILGHQCVICLSSVATPTERAGGGAVCRSGLSLCVGGKYTENTGIS